MSSPSTLNAKIVNLALVAVLAGAGFFTYTKYNEFLKSSSELTVQESLMKSLEIKQENVKKLKLPDEKVAKKNYQSMITFLKNAGVTELTDEKESQADEWGLKSKSVTIKVAYEKALDVLGLAKQQGWVIEKISKKEQIAFITLSVTVQGDK